MRLAIFARTFARDSLEAVLDAVAAHGIDAVQFNPVLLGGASLPESLAPADAGRVAAAHASRVLHGLAEDEVDASLAFVRAALTA